MNSVRVRAAQAEDCAALAQLVTQLGYPTDTAAMQRRFGILSKSEQCATLVAECDDKVCGMLGMDTYRVWHRDEPLGHLATMVVDERYRSQGVATKLLRAAENWLRERDVHYIVLTSASHRAEAHRFYLKQGYSLTGQRFAKAL